MSHGSGEVIKTVVAGAAGRMGRTLISLILQDRGLRLVGAVEAPNHPALGKDVGELVGMPRLGLTLTDDYSAVAKAETVTLDFTNAEASLEHLRIAAENQAAIVVGSTGFTSQSETRARELGAKTRTVIAPNMSVGVNLLLKLVAEAAAVLGDFDIEVIELHHRTKVDAPSGTALALGRTACSVRGWEADKALVFGRQGLTGKRPAQQVGIMALRAGDAIGDHTVIFGGAGERLELTHRAQSRDCLAHGALRAARWLVYQPPGVYSMRDVLGL